MKKEKMKIEKIIEELEEFFLKEDLEGGKRHLEKSLEKAKEIGDWQSELSILNEMIGFYRRSGDKNKALESVKRSFFMIEEKGMDDSVSAGTYMVEWCHYP
jgi:hypothetical protein